MAGEPSRNLLAQAGLITNEAGRVFEPPCGRLNLPWLLRVSPEDARRARQHLGKTKSVDQVTRVGWFIASTEKEFKGFDFLLKKDWRRALKAWGGGSLYNVHNRATLHRALFHCEDAERPEAHLRECLRLYHHLSELNPSESYYRVVQEELIDHLKTSVERHQADGNDESVSRSLKVLSQTVGMVAVSHFQQQFFGKELDRLKINCAKISKELLSYQGTATPPPDEIMDAVEKGMAERVLPLASRFSHKLVEGSKERNEVEKAVALVCGIISQSYVKLGDSRGSKKWLGEAHRWEPSAVQGWSSLPDEDFGEAASAVVSFPELEEDEAVTPRNIGSLAFGVQARVVQRMMGESREEWLESLYLAFLPIFPTGRFAAYRNLDTDEVGYYIRIPLTALDHLRQGLVVLVFSFLLVLGGMAAGNILADSQKGSADLQEQQRINREISVLVEDLKRIAQEESALTSQRKLNPKETKRLQALQDKRLTLIKKLEKLEKRKSQSD